MRARGLVRVSVLRVRVRLVRGEGVSGSEGQCVC